MDPLDLPAIFGACEGESRGHTLLPGDDGEGMAVHLHPGDALLPLDGSKIKVCASKHAAMSYARMQEKKHGCGRRWRATFKGWLILNRRLSWQRT